MIRTKVIKNAMYRCRYCGGIYNKYLYCIHIDNNYANFDFNNLDIVCKLCFMLTNLNYFLDNNEMILLRSTLNQNDIVRKTIDGIREYGFPPDYTYIDPDVQKITISLIEYILIYSAKQDSGCNYKIFFTKNLDRNFVNSIIEDMEIKSWTSSLFSDIDLDHTVDTMDTIDTVDTQHTDMHCGNNVNFIKDFKEYILTKSEKILLNNLFGHNKNKKIILRMLDTIIVAKNKVYFNNIDFEDTNFKHKLLMIKHYKKYYTFNKICQDVPSTKESISNYQ